MIKALPDTFRHHRRFGRHVIRAACVAIGVFALWPHAAHAGDTLPPGTRVPSLDARHVLGRSDIVLERPNMRPAQSMPLGNGRLGAAVWAADGMTVQLNRADTFPDRKSVGQVIIPGLKTLTGAADFKGRVDLYDGLLKESGHGMTATAYVDATRDAFIVDVTGAAPGHTQTVRVQLWPPRAPRAEAHAGTGTLAESWIDKDRPGASGRRFGTLAAVTASGRDVRASVIGPRTVQVAFRPHADGRFRIIIASPRWHGGDAAAQAASVLKGLATAPTGRLRTPHLAFWHRYWHQVGLMRLQSPGGVAAYMENLRAVYLYLTAAEERARLPGSNGGVANLFLFDKDHRRWDPSAYWHWNLRMLVAANLGAGAFDFNAPYFRLYRDNLQRLRSWTRTHMKGLPGICIPETMRFNGQGFEYETWLGAHPTHLNCDATSTPYFNARTISTGAEVGLWIWNQYRYTGNRAFLARNYPVMAAAARFLLAYAKPGKDGYLHTEPSNAHETQWDVRDPTTDLAAMKALFPALIDAAGVLHRDPGLVARLKQAITQLRPFPRTDAATHRHLPSAADDDHADVIGPSYQPGAKRHNNENIGLEPVWPYQLIDLGSSPERQALARRTYAARVTPHDSEWSFAAVDAARLGQAKAVRDNLIALTRRYQAYPSGMASLSGKDALPYIEQSANVALALQEALAQVDHHGVLRVAPAWPRTWDANATVFTPGALRVDVSIRHGALLSAMIEGRHATTQRVANPWPGHRVQIWEIALQQHGDRPHMLTTTTTAVFSVPLRPDRRYLLRPADGTHNVAAAAPADNTPARHARTLGPVSIGLPATP